MKSYKDLEIHELAYRLVLDVHEISLRLPQYEIYEEGSQVRRSSKGVAFCIAEGFGRRRYKAVFMRFLIYAQASCDETLVHLNFVKDTHTFYVMDDLLDRYRELGGKIGKFIQYVDQHGDRGLAKAVKLETVASCTGLWCLLHVQKKTQPATHNSEVLAQPSSECRKVLQNV